MIYIGANFVITIVRIIQMLLSAYAWIISIYILTKWIQAPPTNQVFIFVQRLSEPAFKKVRRFVRPLHRNNMSIDLAPFIVILIIVVINTFILENIVDLAMAWKR